MSRRYGVYLGTVADVDDPQGEGRVKVSFPWMGEDADGYWAPVASLTPELTVTTVSDWPCVGALAIRHVTTSARASSRVSARGVDGGSAAVALVAAEGAVGVAEGASLDGVSGVGATGPIAFGSVGSGRAP